MGLAPTRRSAQAGGDLVGDRQSYAFDNARAGQRERLHALQAALDPGTVRQLDAVGVAAGWRCLEVGAGAGSIAAWLCERVGRTGSVLATDLDPALLGELSAPNLDVRVHDVVTDELPAASFDLVHARLLLAWLADPAVAVRRLVAALKPDGVLVVEEMDFSSVCSPDPVRGAAFERVVAAHNAVLAEGHRFDPTCGRRVEQLLVSAGLTDVRTEGRTAMWHGADAGGRVWELTLMQLHAPMLATGLIGEDDLEEALLACRDPTFGFLSQVTMAGWGRRPAPA